MNRLISIALVCLLQVSLAVASTFNLRVEVTPDGAGSLNTSGGTYEEGSKINLRTYANTGYVFKGWYEGETLLSSSTSFSYTMPSNDALVQARYEYDPAVPGNPAMPDTTTYYSLTAIVSPVGAGSLNTYSGKYAAGASVNMRTYGNTGYKFVGWQNEGGETVSTSSSFNYTIPRGDSQLTALYDYDPSVPANPDSMATRYTVTIACKPVGGGTFNTTSATAEEGGNVHLYAYTNTGYKFLRWENEIGETISTAQNFYYVMPHGNSKVYGIFEFDPATPSNPNKNYWNKELGEVIVDDFTPGSLGNAVSSVINGSNRNDVTMITVAGRMNDNDFGIANNYTNCTLLDLSRVTGITQVPSYAFDYTKLESVYLPATIEKIGYRAFYECKQLSSLIVYAMMPPTLENNVFTGVPEGLVIYVPASAIAQYQEATGWKDFTILPIQEDIRSISISLPDGSSPQDYAQMWLELTNTKNGQRMHYVMTDRQTYTFANIIRNTSWNVTLRNERGDIFGQIDNVEVKDEDVAVTFASLSKPQNVSLTVLTPDGKDATSQVQVTWTDAQDHYMSQGASLSGLAVGYQVNYRMVLSQELAMAYDTPSAVEYTLKDGGNALTYQLQAIKKLTISGKVKDASTGLALNGAAISASQTFGGKYSKTLTAKTDNNGAFSMEVFNVPTSIAIAASDYVSQTIDYSNNEFNGLGEFAVPDVSLKSITGATISVGFTYTTVEGETQNWYSDYQNVSYTIYNSTREKPISQFNVQYPQIVLLEEVEDGDVLRLTATSRTNAFKTVEATATITEQRAEATFGITELGRIEASFSKTGNASVVASLYDASGKLVKTYNYSEAKLTISDLADGNYTLVSMGSSRLFNTIYDLAQLPQTGLAEGTDYVHNTVEVKSGAISTINIEEVPTLDESKFYYTGDNTSFTVNKPSIVAGNYLTLTGRIDFKPTYATSVSNVQMIVDLPESCQFVENSVMVGNSTSSYTLNGNRITIPMTRYTDRVRFCIIPTLGGEYAPSAFSQFDLNGETVTQPIGSANYTCKNLSITVPSNVAKTSIPISGTAIGSSTIEIYDDGVMIGQTTSLANGAWTAFCELNEPYNLSTHSISAKAITKSGIELVSETMTCQYNKNAIEPLKVTMINVAHPASSLNLCEYVTVFDFKDPGKAIPSYWYWPNYPDFTFLVDFTNNDTTVVSNVQLHVLLTDNSLKTLTPQFDEKQNCWVATSQFHSYALPQNVNVEYTADTKEQLDRRLLEDLQDNVLKAYENAVSERSTILDDWNNEGESITQSAVDELNELIAQDSLSISFLRDKYANLLSTTDASDVNLDSLLIEIDGHLDEYNEKKTILGEKYEYFLSVFSTPYRSTENFSGEYECSYNTFGGITSISKKEIAEVKEEQLLKGGYEKIQLTDSTYIYYFADSKLRRFIDAKSLTCYEIVTESDSVNNSRRANAIGDCASALEGIIHSMSDFYNGAKEVRDVGELRHLLGSASSLIKSSFDAVDCIYQSKLNEIEIKFGDLVETLTRPIENHLATLNSDKDALSKSINKMMDDIEGLEKSITQYNIDIDKLENELKLATNEADKIRIQEKINSYKKGKEILRSQQADIGKNLEKANAKLGKLIDNIADLSNKMQGVKEKFKATKDFLAKIPRSLKQAKELKFVKWTGRIAKVVGTPLGATLQIIPIGIDIYDLSLELDEWIKFCDAVLAKYPCEGNPQGWLQIAVEAALSGSGSMYAGVQAIKAEIGAMVLDYVEHPYAWVGSILLDLFSWGVQSVNNKFANSAREFIYADLKALKCNKDDQPEDNTGRPWWWPFPPVGHVMDPSGYIYEGVASNRLEGVTATAYYKEEVEDMYGDLHENIVKWDASEYAQENPLFTDEYGMYAWDVPNGLWQVKFEKEGYETTYSEWLPVPPPQLDVNIAMKQNVQPTVKLAHAYEDAVEVEFDKYMMPELLTTDNIIVMQGNEAVAGSVELLNNEASYEGSNETFASKIRFNAVQPFAEQEITLMVSNRVKSYAGIRMQDDYQQKFTIEQEIKQIAADSVITVGYGNASTFVVSVLPVSASKGKMLTVKTSSPMILSVETEQVTIGNDGKAEIAVNGELPGTAALTFSVEGTDKTAMTIANVGQIVIKTVATPKASIASGTVVEKGTAITLTCETEGATIYYTLDGSCPCDNTDARKVYDGTPIIINENVTIKAMAVAPDMYESEVAEFTYIVDGTGIDDIIVNGQIQIYPLPVRDKVNISAGGKAIKSVTISSMNGVVVASANKLATTVTLDVSRIPTGIYIINVTTVDSTFSRKILKVE